MAFEDVAELLIVLDADDRATEKINNAKRAITEYAAAVDAANAEMAAANAETGDSFSEVDSTVHDAQQAVDTATTEFDDATAGMERMDSAGGDVARTSEDVRKAVDDMANEISNAKAEEDELSSAFEKGMSAADNASRKYDALDVATGKLNRDLRALHKALGDEFAATDDTAALRDHLTQLDDILEQLGQDVRTVGSDAVDSFGRAGYAIRALNDELRQGEQAASANEKAMKRLSQAGLKDFMEGIGILAEMTQGLDDVQAAADEAAAANDRLGSVLQGDHSAFTVLKDSVDETVVALHEGDAAYADFKARFEEAKADIEGAVGPTRDMVNAVKGVGDAADTAAQDVTKLGSSASSASGGMSTWIKVVLGIAALAPVVSGVLLGGVASAFVVLAGIAEKSNTRITTAFTNLKNTIENGAKDAAAVLVPTLVTAMNDLSRGLNDLAPEFKTLFASLKPVVMGLEQAVLGFIQGALPGLNAAFKNLAPLAAIFGSSMKALGVGLGGMFQQLSQHMPSIVAGTKGFFQALGNLLPALGALLGEVSDLVGPLEGELLGPLTKLAGEIIQDCAPAFKLLGDMLGQLGKALAPLIPPLSDLAKVVIDAITQALKALQPAWNSIINAVKQLVPPVTQLIQALVKVIPPVAKILTGFVEVAAAILSVVIPAVTAIIKVITFLVTLLIEGLTGALTWVANKVSGFASAISNKFQQAGQWVSQHWNASMQDVKHAVSDVVSAVTNAWGGFVHWIETGISQFVSTWKQRWQDVETIWLEVVTYFKLKGEDIINWLKALPGRIEDIGKNAGQWLLNAGKAVLEGFLNGVKAVWKDVTNFFGGIGNWISQHKGPIDKDAVLLTPHGQAIMAGLLRGLQTGAGPVQSYLKSFTTQLGNTPLSASMSAAMSGGVGGVGGSQAPIQLVFTGNQVMSDADIGTFANKVGQQVAKYVLPQAGRYVKA